jgi:hypothetical protein
MASTLVLPPGLTCDQYYLYLASGFAYCFRYGVMYHTSQIPSEGYINQSGLVAPFDPKLSAIWLTNGYYYDFACHKWLKATFVQSNYEEKRIWEEASGVITSARKFKRKTDEVTAQLNSMTLKPGGESQMPLCYAFITQPCRSTMRKTSSKVTGKEMEELRKVQGTGKCIKSGHRSQIKSKIKTVPADLAQSKGFWETVL